MLTLEPRVLEETKRILAFWAPGVPVYAFGSRVHGRNLKPHSDLDLCLKADRPVADRVLRQVADAFDVSDIPIRVDVVDWHRLAEGFRAAIEGDLERVV